MAAEALAIMSEDKEARFEYEQRLDNIRAHKWLEQEYKRMEQKYNSIEQEKHRMTIEATAKDQQIKTLANAMYTSGTPAKEIAQILNKTEQEVVVLIST